PLALRARLVEVGDERADPLPLRDEIRVPFPGRREARALADQDVLELPGDLAGGAQMMRDARPRLVRGTIAGCRRYAERSEGKDEQEGHRRAHLNEYMRLDRKLTSGQARDDAAASRPSAVERRPSSITTCPRKAQPRQPLALHGRGVAPALLMNPRRTTVSHGHDPNGRRAKTATAPRRG